MNTAMRSRQRLAAFLLPAALLLSAAAVHASPQRSSVELFDRTVPLPAGGSFSISNVNGSIDIVGWNRDEVEISARKITVGLAESLRQVAISVDLAPGSVSVSTRYAEGSGAEVNVEFHIRVPARVFLASIATVNGSVAVHDVSGEGSLATVNGNIMLSRGSGLFSARATNGNVALELLSLEGGLPPPASSSHRASLRSISAQTINGSVVIALPDGAGVELDARTRNGDFSSDLPLLAHISAAGRAVRGRIASGGPLLQLRTVNGSIRLRISQPLV